MTDPTEKVESQLDKFKEAARELETYNDEGRFDEKLRRLVKATPSVSPTLKRDEYDEQKD